MPDLAAVNNPFSFFKMHDTQTALISTVENNLYTLIKADQAQIIKSDFRLKRCCW